MTRDIQWINTTAKTYDYATEAVIHAQEHGRKEHANTYDVYTAIFEIDAGVSNGEDIGGLIVYSNDCVYDYENFCGWVR